MNTPNEGARLIANNVLQATQTQGLVAVVRHQIETTLSDLVGVLLSKAACDFRRVLRPVGEQTHSINIEPYHGHQTWARFRTEIAGCESLVALDKIIQENQPVLFGHVSHSGGSQQIGDVVALVLPLCAAVLRYERSKLSIDESIAKVISELDQILTAGFAIQEHLTVLSGLKFPSEIECVALSSDTVIRRLTENEISEFGSSDITSDGRHTFTLQSASTALVVRRKTRVLISEQSDENLIDTVHIRSVHDQVHAVLCSLNIVKTGRVGALVSFTTYRPTVLLNMSGFSSYSPTRGPMGSLELTAANTIELVSVHQKLISSNRDEVRIGATRLLDAETRMSPVDSLLDAIIGLEVLLNPNDRDELAFRVALNYAYLGGTTERRIRYDAMRDIQKTRNQVVHGGLNLASRNAQVIYDHASVGRDCLRDALTRFLSDSALGGNLKLDASFWLDRVIPPNT